MGREKIVRVMAAWMAVGMLLSGCGSREKRPEAKAPRMLQKETTASTVEQSQEPRPEIPETEIYSKDGIKVAVTGLNENLFGTDVSFAVTNDSEKNVVVTSRQLSVNGYMMPASGLVCEVAAGKRANSDLTLMSGDLKQAGIDTIGELAFYLQISDSQAYETIGESELIRVETTLPGSFLPASAGAGEQVYAKDGVKVVCRGLQEDPLWEGMLVFCMENNSDLPITVYAENVSVNGYMADVSLWADLRANTKIVDGMYLMDLRLPEAEGIDAIQEIEFTLRIVNGTDWSIIETTDPITLGFA